MIYYTLYRTTCLVSGRVYIGVHETKNPGDNYMGSGNLLLKAIKKYGKDNFRKDVAAYFVSREEMYAMEKLIVNEKFLNRRDVYNAKVGGIGGFRPTPEQSLAQSARGKKLMSDPEHINAMLAKRIVAVRNLTKEQRSTIFGKRSGCHGPGHAKKISIKAKIRCKGKGNSQYGTCWVHNNTTKKNAKATPETLKSFLEKGWFKGRKMKF